jgi:hypothetical protein
MTNECAQTVANVTAKEHPGAATTCQCPSLCSHTRTQAVSLQRFVRFKRSGAIRLAEQEDVTCIARGEITPFQLAR